MLRFSILILRVTAVVKLFQRFFEFITSYEVYRPLQRVPILFNRRHANFRSLFFWWELSKFFVVHFSSFMLQTFVIASVAEDYLHTPTPTHSAEPLLGKFPEFDLLQPATHTHPA